MNYALRMTTIKKTKKQKNKKTSALTVGIGIVFLFSCFLVLFAQSSYAQLVPSPTGQLPEGCTSTNCGNYTLNDFVAIGIGAADWILGIVGSLALLFFVYGGLMWILSAGKSENIEKGKDIIRNALVGLLIVFASWTIINFVTASLGYNTEFFGDWFKTP